MKSQSQSQTVPLSKRDGESPRAFAARKGWDTRRANETRKHRQTFKANPDPDEESSGDFAYTLYDAAHPMTGEPETVALWKGRASQYYGERVRVSLNGFRVDPKTGKRVRIFIRRVGQLDGYGDLFGPGSLYAKAAKVVRNRGSEDELVITSVTIERADENESDEE